MLKYSSKFVISVLCCLFLGGTIAFADEVRLKDGTVIKADSVWENAGSIWYRQGNIIRSLPKSDLAPVIVPKTRLRKAIAPAVTAPAVPIAVENKPSITQLVLTDGTKIEVDSSWKSGDKIAYRLGNMQSFIDSKLVLRIEQKTEASAVPSLPEPDYKNFTGSTGHRGLDYLITSNASRHGVDPRLIYLVMQTESGFNHRAVSRVGARGLMQLMPGTARLLGVRNIDDPSENVEAGTRYLKKLLTQFGDVNLALAAYNAGEGAVIKYGNRVPPYRETINYVQRIGWAYYRMKQ